MRRPYNTFPMRIAAALPSLKYILVTQGNFWNGESEPCFGWRVAACGVQDGEGDVARSSGMFFLKEMDEEEAEALRDREQLMVEWERFY